MLDELRDALRLAAAFQLLLVAFLLVRDYRQARGGRATATLALSVVCHLMSPVLLRHHVPALLTDPVLVGGLTVPLAFWATTRLHFDDAFRWTAAHAGISAVLLLVRWLATLLAMGRLPGGSGPGSPWQVASAGIAVVVVAEALLQLYKGAPSDLVLSRLRLRYWVLMVSGAYALLVIVGEVLVNHSRLEVVLGPANDVGLFLVVFGLLALLLRLDPAFLRRVGPATEEPAAFDDLEQELDQLVQHDQAFKEPGLTIGGLAARLHEPEHRLRQLINLRLGFRNFNAFLNNVRIQEARRILADPLQKRLGIAEVAFSVGYNSLGPFNRAFKEVTGRTPGEFRKTALG